MGVDFYNCDNCGEIYADCVGGSCEGCDSSWCNRCDDIIRSFFYNGNIRCDLCFQTRARNPTNDLLLYFALEKLKMTLKDLKEEFKGAQEIEKYECTRDPLKHDCTGHKCHDLSMDWENPEYHRYSTTVERGVCCSAKGIEGCKGCRNKK